MGNILESSSESEKEDVITESKFDVKSEVRTLGDGMECENVELKPGGDVEHVVGITKSLVGFTLGVDNQRIRFDGTSETPDDKWASGLPVKSVVVAQSPKQFPPRDKLIVLKPSPKSPCDPVSNNTSFNKMISTSEKQKEPRFVPYEPYKGATRSMTVEDSSMKSSHSRKPSGGSTTSTTSSVNVGVDDMKSPPSTSKNPEQPSSPNVSHLIKVQETLQNVDMELSGHSMLLLKERLKMHEKDVNELQLENSRLKKMLVDSMSGFGSTPTTTANNISQTTRSKLRLDGTSEHGSMSESFDNLTDEISVWRSKFLSTCVLVEQLTKQNQDLKLRVTGATEIFREMKQSSDVALNPLFFDKINAWIHQSVNNYTDHHHEGRLNGAVSALNHAHDIANNDNSVLS